MKTLTRRGALRSLATGSLLALSAIPSLGLVFSRRDTEKLALLKKYENDPVKIFYIEQGFLKTADDVMKLHMFFSPYSIPPGMIRSEVRQCIELYDLRQEYNSIHNQMNSKVLVCKMDGKDDLILLPAIWGPSLPEEFSSIQPMTRERFAAGIRAFHNKLARRREKHHVTIKSFPPEHRKLLEEQFRYYGYA